MVRTIALIAIVGFAAMQPGEIDTSVARSSASAQIAKSCKTTTVAPPSGQQWANIIDKLRVRGVSCRFGANVIGKKWRGDRLPKGWKCRTSSKTSRTICSRGTKRRASGSFGGTAG